MQVQIRGVLDSSVLVPVWSRIALHDIAAQSPQPFVPIWSEWIIAETWRVLTWRWAARASRIDEQEARKVSDAANEMMRRLLSVMTFVTLKGGETPPPWPGLRDAGDIAIWETAYLSGARYVISQNVRDFPPLVDGKHRHHGIEYLTAIEFIEDVLGQDLQSLSRVPLPLAANLRSRRAR